MSSKIHSKHVRLSQLNLIDMNFGAIKTQKVSLNPSNKDFNQNSHYKNSEAKQSPKEKLQEKIKSQ